MSSASSQGFFSGPAFYRIVPFAAFMLFIAVEEGLAFLQRQGVLLFDETLRLWLYAPKIAVTLALLIAFRRHYSEIDLRELTRLPHLLLSVAVGIAVFALWINMAWSLSEQAAPPGFDPRQVADPTSRWLLTGLRCSGAVIVVPIMEELFWRSFLLRWLIDRDFMTVAVGRLSWFAVLATTVLFGLEHHYVFAGMMAGALFTLVYWQTGSIIHCILCHAVANLGLAWYVLATAQWQFW